jgi:hypothetical protein
MVALFKRIGVIAATLGIIGGLRVRHKMDLEELSKQMMMAIP